MRYIKGHWQRHLFWIEVSQKTEANMIFWPCHDLPINLVVIFHILHTESWNLNQFSYFKILKINRWIAALASDITRFFMYKIIDTTDIGQSSIIFGNYRLFGIGKEYTHYTHTCRHQCSLYREYSAQKENKNYF